MTTTVSVKPAQVERNWLLIDAEGVILGRLAAYVADRLRGKHKPYFTPHVDCGDNIVIVNVEKVVLTGRKRDHDIFYWHTGYPGGIKQRSKGQILDGDHPERVIQKAVERMLPKTKLGRAQLKNLRAYAGPSHPHEGQNPTVIDMKALNPKNVRSL